MSVSRHFCSFGLFIATFLQILLNHKSSQEFDIVTKPNLHYKMRLMVSRLSEGYIGAH